MDEALTNRELRILMLEDTPTDAELAERELSKAGIDFTSLRVETRESFVRALEDFHPDIIMSDYKLPDFNGMAALEIVRRDHPEVPVVMVTGALSDIEAVELIHAGAKDYVLKDRLARLAPAVQRALAAERSARARKAAEKALLESEAKFRALVESTSDWIWEIDEEWVYMYSSPQVHDLLGYSVVEVIGKTPFELMPPNEREQDKAKLRAILAEHKHFRLMENVLLHDDGRLIYLETSGAPMFDAQGVFRGYRGIGRDITERKKAERERLDSAEKLKHSLLQIIESIAATVEARDPYTAGHQRRVAILASAIAHEMGLSESKIQGLYLAATIHDLGKVSLPAEILSKPTQLNSFEYDLIKTHSQIGHDIIKDVQFPWPIAPMILQHHERLNGSGYPQGLTGEQMQEEAKILAVADVVEAMSSDRPYRPGLGLDAALDEIVKQRGVLYEPVVVDCCIALFRAKQFTFEPK
ncbi:MAG: PAS domain S-box protein [Gammaproteobacteria bacterium]|nr:PAS domain S-box protein [Gammaproteobacteria bacterium]MBU1447074.1 PAS domain S-box protein [Gammaproteobacteria bacterium]